MIKLLAYFNHLNRCLIILGLQFSFCFPVSAKVVINELLPDLPSGVDENQEEWVELYNLSDDNIDISGYVLEDEKLNRLVINSQHTIDSITQILPKSYLLIYRRGSSFSLNNDSDKIWLYESTQSATPIDSVAYGKTKNNKSIGRFANGTGDFYYDLFPTPNQPNSTPQPSPLVTSTPQTASEPKYSPNPVMNTPKDIETKSSPNQTKNISTTEFSKPNSFNSTQILGESVTENQLEFTESSSSSRKHVIGNLSVKESSQSSDDINQEEKIVEDEIQPNQSRSYLFFILGGSTLLVLTSWKIYQKKLWEFS